MNSATVTRIRSKRIVLLSSALLVVLGGSLALRVVNKISAGEQPPQEPRTVAPRVWNGPAPPAEVPAPHDASPEGLAYPRWVMYTGPIHFQTDLDLIAPLGDGTGNAALWFADFTRPSGARFDEFQKALRRAEEANREAARAAGVLPRGAVLLPDDPLLLEAEPWIDQATMRFYPDLFEFQGWETRIPNLLMYLRLARSWIARGDSTGELEVAMEDYRRAIRLGRLIRQEDAVVINDLVGLTCVGLGLEAMYARLAAAGETERALVVALPLGEVAPQRLTSSELLTSLHFMDYVNSGWLGVSLDVPDGAFHTISSIAEKDPDRRFRFEAMLVLNLTRFEGTRQQRRESLELLERLADDDDALIAGLAAWARDTRIELSDYAGY